MSLSLSFPDSVYSASNKPSDVTLKADLTAIEADVNAIPAAAETYTNKTINIEDNIITTDIRARAYKSAAANSANGAYAKVDLDAENYDPGGDFANGTYTVPVTGYYMISGGALATTGQTMCAIYKNGSVENQGSTSTSLSQVSDILALIVGDTIELWLYTNAVVAIGVGSKNTHLSIHLLSV